MEESLRFGPPTFLSRGSFLSLMYFTHAIIKASGRSQYNIDERRVWDSQSSYAIDWMRNNLVYNRISTAKKAKHTQNTMVITTRTCMLGGLSRFGVTPMGGLPAGPFSIDWTDSGVIAVVEVAMMICRLDS